LKSGEHGQAGISGKVQSGGLLSVRLSFRLPCCIPWCSSAITFREYFGVKLSSANIISLETISGYISTTKAMLHISANRRKKLFVW